MNKTSLLFLLGAIGPLGSAYAMSVDIESKVEDSEILLGRINNELATNYVGDKLIELKWVTKEGKTISTKPYLIPNSSMKDIRFCVSSEQTATCSTSWSTSHALRSASSPNFTAGNTANLTVRVLDNDSLKYEEPATSISNFDIISGRFGFHYTEQLDQHGHVVMNMISYSQPSIFLTLPSIESNMKTIKACSVGGFYLDEPTYIESCTPSYTIDSSPLVPEPQDAVLCLYQHPNFKGNDKCFDEEEINHSQNMTSPKFPHLMASYGLVDSSSLTLKAGFRATVGDFSGHNSTINDTWNQSVSFLGNTVGDKGKHVFLETDDTYGCFFQHHALHYGEFERGISQCVEVGDKIEQLTPLKSGLQRTLSTITMHPGLEITLYSDLNGSSKLGSYNQARFWTGSSYPNDRAKSFSISVDKNYSFYLVNDNTLLRSLENSSLALKNLITEKGDLHLVTSNGHWAGNFVLPEGVAEFTRLKFERKSAYHFNVINGETTYIPNYGDTLVMTYINHQWVQSGDLSMDSSESFMIFNSLYRGCFDFRGGASSRNNLILETNCHGTGAQALIYDEVTKQIKVEGTNYCLDVYWAHNGHRQPVIAYQCHSGNNQKWEFESDKTIKSLLGGTQRCLDVDQHRLDSVGNSTLTLWSCSPGSRDQQFMKRAL